MRHFARNALGLVYMNLLDPDLFRTDISVARARELFVDYCGGVEIENHNYCNRTCWFCPNAQIDRRTDVTLMPDALFAKIIDDLASVDWHRKLSWSRYHEAFADDSIFDRLTTARAALPRAVERDDVIAGLRKASPDRDELLDQGDTLLMLIQQHNQKEEHILYPMCENALDAEWTEIHERLASYPPIE